MLIVFQVLVFGITGLVLYYGVYYGTPRLVKKGVPLLFAFWFFLWFPVLTLLPITLLFYLVEGNDWTFVELVNRFRLYSLTGSDWLWVGGAVVATILFDQLLEPIGKVFAKMVLFAPPSYLPAPFNPLKKMELPPADFFGVKMYGNWKLLFLFVPVHLLAMFSEEMMWRGYFLPIQEGMVGDWAWVLNGLLWAWLVHVCLKWHFISMLPSMLIAPWIAQYTGSTWASFAVHAIGNSVLWMLLGFGIIKKR